MDSNGEIHDGQKPSGGIAVARVGAEHKNRAVARGILRRDETEAAESHAGKRILIDTLRLFYRDHRQALFVYALSLTRSRETAEDIVQTVFYRLLRRGRLPKELRPYAFRAVRNAATDLARREERGAKHASIFASPEVGADAAAIALRDEMAALLDGVGGDERECIVLKTYNGLTFQEISAVLGVPVGTAASWYRRGIEKMRRQWEELNR